MKKTLTLSFLLIIFSAAFINPVKAQDVTKELQQYIRKFEAAYNMADAKAIKEMFSTDAVMVLVDGTTTKGNANIGAAFAKQFNDISGKIEIKQYKVTKAPGGSTTSEGIYSITGKNNEGMAIQGKYGFINTLRKIKGQWKITKLVQTKA